MTRTTARGTCALCGYGSSKAGLTRHLKSCPGAHDGSRGRPAKFHLRAEDAESPLYWLDLEIKKSATLTDLDAFLREVWLECCGHLSMFEIGGVRYTVDYGVDYGHDMFDDPDERSMRTKLGVVLAPGLTFAHEYDFGSTTYLKLKVVGEREGRIGPDPLRLLARNDAPTWECSVCGAAAAQIDTEAMWEEGNPFYCELPAKGEEWAFLPVVNSPRMGVCGYTAAVE
jgi:hypothetical protein